MGRQFVPDETFKHYSPKQAAAYSANRSGYYPPSLFQTIYNFHLTTPGAELGTAVDVGCGPGISSKVLAEDFDHVFGVDQSAGMLSAAQELSVKTKSGEDMKFVQCPAEELDRVIPARSADLITSSMASHWFDMERFWPAVDKVLKPGGSIALWTCNNFYAHPNTPNREQIQNVLSTLEDDMLADYEAPGNRLSRHLYAEMVMPWDISSPVSSLRPENHVRYEWDKAGNLSNGKSFFLGDKPVSLKKFQLLLESVSMVQRWREANPKLVGTERDVVTQTINQLRALLEGKDELVMGAAVVLLLFKKSTRERSRL